MKAIFLILILFSTSTFAQGYPRRDFDDPSVSQECRDQVLNDLAKNATPQKPKNGPVYELYTTTCWENSSTSGWFHYEVPLYWNPGKKLPHYELRKLELSFLNQITIAKGKGQFKKVLGFLVDQAVQRKIPQIHRFLERAGLAQTPKMDSNVKKLLKNAVIDVMITLNFPNKPNRYNTEVISYYGLYKAKEFGLIDPNLDIAWHSNEISNILSRRQPYAMIKKQLSKYLDGLNIAIF